MNRRGVRHHASNATLVGTILLSFILIGLVLSYFASDQQPSIGHGIMADQTFGTNITMRYPPHWKYAHSLTQDGTTVSADETDVTSPSGTITIQLIIAHSTIDGPCSNDQTKLVSVHRDPVTGYPTVNLLSYIESFQQTPTDTPTYSYFIGIGDNSDEDIQRTTLTSNSACELNYAGLLNLDDIQKGEDKPLITAQINFNNLNGKTLTPDIITAQMQGQEYQEAKATLQSFTNK